MNKTTDLHAVCWTCGSEVGYNDAWCCQPEPLLASAETIRLIRRRMGENDNQVV